MNDNSIMDIWEGNTVQEESIMFVPDAVTGEIMPCRLLYPPTRILQVCSADHMIQYEENIDYGIKDGYIVRLSQGKIPFFHYEEYFLPQPASIPIESIGSEGRFVRYEPGGIEYHRRQVRVTYEHNGTWPGEKPRSQLKYLIQTTKKLKEKEDFHLLFYGDSFMEGCDASGRSGVPPYMPTLDKLVMLYLSEHYEHKKIQLTNTALGGTTSVWGAENAKERVAKYRPDLVVVRYGMNDSGADISLEEFEKNIRNIIETCRRENARTEFLLLSPDLPNPDCKGWCSLQPYYGSVLKKIAQSMQGCVSLDMTRIFKEISEVKGYPSITGNGVNHPNDYMIRVYAGAICRCLSDTLERKNGYD